MMKRIQIGNMEFLDLDSYVPENVVNKYNENRIELQ
jgi:hypothetical protein